ncbi:Ankyrin repeat-containing protein P16F5.05c [Schizosaccharomyces pombe]|uniref:Ankyrin repeat-containing protein P16F5.05c n=1 Tax=Schizosaccharomyces pombe (strain 972 / ATCC 24843) TaxID=284812 RepID=YNW5_SCHPO|nr:putative ribosome biogenesis protein Nop8 [Schizosaccharomyces pombe]Q9HFE7.1 RecName: Full=Ankyrin repeat-containing protein P16F5.05c [Schizosaccharomyces pombe 972h-]CAC08544.1 ribosome biogenesis protein Nop8 (predicted) [Schizosaccharomyces pombe]|eukprot:NP_595779.1 putative ribosome biogenesis protein Nop8 [Schizosaccharomyces pombe]
MDVDDLIYACRAADEELLDEIIEKCPQELSRRDENGNSGLHMASANGHIAVVQKIIPYLNKEVINAQNESGNTAMHWAALNGHAEICKLLLEAGGDPHIKNIYEKSPIYEADIRNQQKVMDLFLDFEIAKGSEENTGDEEKLEDGI